MTTSSLRQKTRVLCIANTGWYLRNFRSRLVERLERSGCEVILAAPANEETNSDFFRCRPFEILPLSRKGRNPMREVAALWRFISLLRRIQPDVVLTWTPKPNIYAGLAGRVLGIPVVPNVAGLGFAFIRQGWLAHFAGLLYRIAFRKSDVIFFQNNDDRQQLLAATGLGEDVAQTLPGSGVDLERFKSLPERTGTGFVFLFVGRLIADKGLPELIEAASRLKKLSPDLLVRIVGFNDPGNPAAISEQTIREWESQGLAEYLGATDQIETVLADADCVVLPSYYREGVPRSLLEAAASARPVITTDAIGCREAVVDGESGFLCKPRDISSLAQAMERIVMMSAEDRLAMGQAGRSYMERAFSEDVVLEAYEEAVGTVCERRRPVSSQERQY